MSEYRKPDGSLSQGYYCMTCGRTTNMYASGHGVGYCVPNPELVKALNKANQEPLKKEERQ